MADTPRQVNAAQLASRKIAQSKRRPLKDADRQKPTIGDSVPLFASMPGEQGSSNMFGGGGSAGLFGGAVQAASTFNFSAPGLGPSLNFSPSAFSGGSSTSTWGNANGESKRHFDVIEVPAEDPRADTTGEEAARRNRPFQINRSEDSTPNPFQPVAQSTLNQSGPGDMSKFQALSQAPPPDMSRFQSPSPSGSFNLGAAPVTTQTQPANNIFAGFGRQNSLPPSNSGGFSFGTPPPQAQPASNVFSFGQTSSQSQPASTSGTSFASTPAPTSLFNFGQAPSQSQAPTTNSIFSPASPAMNSIFSQAPTANSIFSMAPDPAPAPAQSTSNFFGQPVPLSLASSTNIFAPAQPQAPASAFNMFGQSNKPSTSTSNIFAKLGANTPATNTLLGNEVETPASDNNLGSTISNIFGQIAQPARSASPSSVFDTGSKENTPPASNMFGNLRPSNPFDSAKEKNIPTTNTLGTAQSSSSIFGSQSPALTSTTLGNSAAGTSTNSLFGTPITQSGAPANPFANLNKPAPQGVQGNAHPAPMTSAVLDPVPAIAAPPSPRPAPASLQNSSTSKPDASSSVFSKSPFYKDVSTPKQLDSILPSVESDDSDRDKTTAMPLFKPAGQPSTSNIFSSMKPVEAPEDASQPAPKGMFPSLSQPSQTPMNNLFSKNEIYESGTPHSPVVNGGGTAVKPQRTHASLFSEIPEVDDAFIESQIPPHYNEEQRFQFIAGFRHRALNSALQAIIGRANVGMSFEPALFYYNTKREEINGKLKNELNNLKRKRGEAIDDNVGSPTKLPKFSNNSTKDQIHFQAPSPEKLHPSNYAAHNSSPERPKNLSPTKSQTFVNGSTTPKAPPPAPRLFPPQNTTSVSPLPKGGKRKAEVQITQNDPDGEIAENRSQKMPKFNGSIAGSETSNIFKNILENSAQPPVPTSPKKMFSLTKTTDEVDKPRANPFASLAIPANSSPIAPAATKLSPFGTSATPAAPSNLFSSTSTTPSSKMDAKSPSTLSAAPSTNILSKPSSTPSANSSNIFGPKAGISTNFFGSKPSTAPAISSPLAKAPSTAEDLNVSASTSKPPVLGSAPASSLSAVKPPIFGSIPAASGNPFKPVFGNAPTSTPTTGGLKPPTFGAPVNFLAQFGRSAADSEKEEMEKAKMEDMDSDEDEDEWEANYKAKRAAKKKEFEEIAKSGSRFSVTPTTSAASSEKGNSPPRSPPKSVFSQPALSATSSNSFFPPANRSAASSPGPMSSNTSSVFEGLSANKPVAFGDNIFGHLSDVDSGADSGKGNDADDDTDELSSEDEEDDEEEQENNEEPEEADDEKKDATYDPKVADPPRPGTPSTPVEETGAGIASTKKSFSFGATSNSAFGGPSKSGFGTPSNSGTSTPSLFDRITKDANGNPIRQLPADDKENASPSTSSIFGNNTASNTLFNFSRSTGSDSTKAPGDNTWKPDSPIKFGASTSTPTFTFSSSTPPPAVNVQAPTPTKGSPFGVGLFGSTNPSPSGTPALGSGSASPFGGLFGSTSTPKPTNSIFANLGVTDNKPPTVGFNFGGPSTATSSLFPSAAGSGVTSRATTPGGTTDGESANDTNGDDAETPLEQVDLASGGAGEEDEEVMFQVRAKAQKYEFSKNSSNKSWNVKGVGMIRILKHKDTGSSRILLRADPSGTIVLNKRILPISYQAARKTVSITTSDDTGKGMETWLLQVKNEESAAELAAALEKYNASSST